MLQKISPRTISSPRVWYPFAFVDRNERTYRVSFRIAEEATWDHRFHDLDGTEIEAGELALQAPDYRFIQSSCDHAVGSRAVPLAVAANNNALIAAATLDQAAGPR
jgi:hypothetical protein